MKSNIGGSAWVGVEILLQMNRQGAVGVQRRRAAFQCRRFGHRRQVGDQLATAPEGLVDLPQFSPSRKSDRRARYLRRRPLARLWRAASPESFAVHIPHQARGFGVVLVAGRRGQGRIVLARLNLRSDHMAYRLERLDPIGHDLEHRQQRHGEECPGVSPKAHARRTATR
jgi:hypothetical protein